MNDVPQSPVELSTVPLAEKVRLLTGASTFTLHGHDGLGLRPMAFSDGPTGVRGLQFSGGPEVTLLPNATVLASSWDEDAAEEVGRILAEEALAQGVHVVLGPTINLHRSPLGGRLFEAYSEDPLLSGRLAAAYVRGMQAAGVGACLKHLVANESETQRNTVSSVVDEATLREIYLLPFEIAVADADPWSVMSAYNRVNGIPATEQHHVQVEVLRDDWGWTGLVMSDWFATTSAAPAANGGLDLVMPGPDGPWGDALVRAVESGEVAESTVDEHVRRLLLLADRVGARGAPREAPADLPTPDSTVRREQMTRLAAAGLTVLTNRGGVLPLRSTDAVALVGRHAVETICMGGGSSKVNPPHQVSIVEGLRTRLASGPAVVDGVAVRRRPTMARQDVLCAPGGSDASVVWELLDADGEVLETRRTEEAETVVGWDDDLPRPCVGIRVRAEVLLDGGVEVGGLGVGDWTLRLAGEERSYAARVDGDGFGEEMLKLPGETFRVDLRGEGPHHLEGTVRLLDADDQGAMAGVARLQIAATTAVRPTEDVLEEARRAARACEVAVVVVGLTEEQETEAVDKSTLALPGDQDDLVRAVAAVAPRTVVVVNAATPVLMPWLDEVDAVLWAGLPGQEGGHAVAAALLGEVEPAGRLVTTFPRADGGSVAWSVTPVDGELTYDEGPWIGYRGHWAGRAPKPLFWAGHGLGYGAWEYADAEVTIDGTGPGALDVAVTLRNLGERESREVVQLYWDPAADDQPVRLVGWTAATVDSGAERRVRVCADARMMRRWDTAAGRWEQMPLDGTVLLARGLGDVRARLDLG
ncbi:glycoside hydrolase family 3 C-terminal domain-containing protein [Nocardioidaceae bacterium]|nr:glycoside hydrolase family 3 C-terminal domain-containing protein [Nocardioidaceae bacterium]